MNSVRRRANILQQIVNNFRMINRKMFYKFYKEYEKLKIEFLQFKKDKLGTAIMQENAQMKEEKKLLSNLELKRL